MNDTWGTPDEIFNPLDGEFNFTIDLCTDGESNSKCVAFTTDIEAYVDSPREELTACWMNPPYSRGNIDKCMKAAWTLSQEGNVVVCLVRFDPSAKWFQKYVDGKATEVRMLKKRPRFVGAPASYPFPCCVVVYEENVEGSTKYTMWGWD